MFLRAPVVFLTLDFVASTNSLELGILNFLCLAIKHFNQRSNHIVERHNFLKEVNGLNLHRLRLLVLLLENNNLLPQPEQLLLLIVEAGHL